jgi:hypothetical protein
VAFLFRPLCQVWILNENLKFPKRLSKSGFLEAVAQFNKPVIPGEPNDFGRDPESKKGPENQNILDLPPLSAGDDELRHRLKFE